jgi:acyl-CoA synthetase (AMP-forming)/AMP-acid ligase II
MWLPEIVYRNSVRYPDQTALRDARREVQWRQLAAEVAALSGRLRQTVPPGGRVLVVSANCNEMIETYFACADAGVIAVPLNPHLTDAELGPILDSVEPALAVADKDSRRRLAAVRPGLPVLLTEDVAGLSPVGHVIDGDLPPAPVSATRPVLILHTSATTGRPKGVVYDQRVIQSNAASWLADVSVQPGTVFLNACPLFHATMLIALHYLAAGATVCVLDRFTPQGTLAAIERWRVNHAYLVPSMVRLILAAKALPDTDVRTLTLLIHGAAPMPAQLAADAQTCLGAELLVSYGSTEAGGPFASVHPHDKPGAPPVPGAACVGVPLPGYTVRLRYAGGQQPGPGETGEIRVAGGGMMSGYWRNPAGTAAVLTDGWLSTGDIGLLDNDGYLWLVDRRVDLILRGGQNVYPAEIEHVLRRSPAVADAAVVPGQSSAWGQTPIAFVQPARGVSEAMLVPELVELCVTQLSSYKRPSRFVILGKIPRSPSGKILRRVLRAQLEDPAPE